MKFKIVDLGRDWKGPQPIPNLSEARNTFLSGLKDDEYVLFIDSDEEAPKILLDYISRLKPQYPYYAIRRMELQNNRFIPRFNPFFKGCLLSNKVKYAGHPHELVYPRKPVGWIDIPIIHNHIGKSSYVNPDWYTTRLFRYLQVLFKLRDIAVGWDKYATSV